VLSEHAADWFDNIPAGEGKSISPYMSMTTTVSEAKRALVPAVTHIDGTARLQTVDKQSNPLYHMLIERFFKLTKVNNPLLISLPCNSILFSSFLLRSIQILSILL
jgi:carbamoyltransferase